MLNLQPLHCGFVSDKGGNTINVHWYTRKQNLHHVSQILSLVHQVYNIYDLIYYPRSNCIPYIMQIWDDSIIETELERFYDSDMGEFIDTIQQNITVF